MRYIGSKDKIVDKIYNEIQKRHIKAESFFDFFAGTTCVSRYFKKLGFQVYSSDILYFSYVLQRAYIVNNSELSFQKLLNYLDFTSSTLFATPLETVVEYLNAIEPIDGFIYKNYTPEGSSDLKMPRMYFSNENGKRIDAIRTKIKEWHETKLINEDEYFVLVACLIETVPFYANISGVYAAFQKKWDPRAVKPLKLRSIELIKNNKINFAYNEDSVNLIKDINVDILYLDPPYNERQYAPNYHMLETIAKYDNPQIKGVTGLRDYKEQKSKFCNAVSAIEELKKIVLEAKYKTLILSYNSEGIMPQEKIISTLKLGGNVELVEFNYLRFKSNNKGESKTKKHIQEQLFILTKHE